MEAPAPIVVAGHPALDLLNTLASPRGEPVEFLGDGAALVRWLVLSGIVAASDARMIPARLSPASLDSAARRAVALREWLRPIVRRSTAHGAAMLTPAELRALNGALARAPRGREVVREDGGYALRTTIDWSTAPSLLVALAEAVADLVTRVDFALVRECAGGACTLWFLDRTKSHRRQWCSMDVCGNRAKVSAHRRRARRGVR